MTALAATRGANRAYLHAAASGVDHAIRVSTAVVVLAVAGIAASISYWHAYAVIREYGESDVTARLEPATIHGLVYASSMETSARRGTGSRWPLWPAGCSRSASSYSRREYGPMGPAA